MTLRPHRARDGEIANEGEAVALVVHHHSVGTVVDTVRSLLDQGMSPTDILIVDNSADTEWARLQAELANNGMSQVRSSHVDNQGYAAAVNYGVSRLRDRGIPSECPVLVCTHETRLEKGALEVLQASIRRPGVTAAGPVLVCHRKGASRIWSAGGVLHRVGMTPGHRLLGRPLSALREQDPYPVDWLDGACVLYTLGCLQETPFDERYFLYFEELDLHYRLRGRGGNIVLVPGAVASQSTAGTPPYFLARNFLLFTEGRLPHYRRVTGLAIVAFRWLPSCRNGSDLLLLLRGIRDYRRRRWGPPC